MKNSIKVLLSMVTISLYGMSLRAQNANTGIYLTEQDYRSNKLSYVLKDHDKLRLNEFLDGKNVSLTYRGKKVTLSKNEIFGYKLNNQDFRFYQNEAYSILDTAGFLLYSREKFTQSVKGHKREVVYFYSVNTLQPIIALAIQNLWNSFPGQTDFRYSIQSNFSKDADLITYDKLSNQYKIKYLFFHQKQPVTAHTTL
jgi:hypothetical protein